MMRIKTHAPHMMTRILSIIMLLLPFLSLRAQVAVKSNLLYDATTTPNIGVEIGIAPQQTINANYGLNLWKFSRHGEPSKAKHWMLQPEWRWWLCSRFSGHFIGVHAMGGQFNASNISLPIPGGFFGGENLTSAVRDTRCQGAFAGAGFTYGYQYELSRHWNIEAEIGAGYNHVWYSKYACGLCGGKIASGHTNYVGLTKLGFSIMYLF